MNQETAAQTLSKNYIFVEVWQLICGDWHSNHHIVSVIDADIQPQHWSRSNMRFQNGDAGPRYVSNHTEDDLNPPVASLEAHLVPCRLQYFSEARNAGGGIGAFSSVGNHEEVLRIVCDMQARHSIPAERVYFHANIAGQYEGQGL